MQVKQFFNMRVKGIFKYILIWMVFLGLSVNSFAAKDSDDNSLPNTIIKSPNDQREYATITLDNQMRVVLISDPSTDKAAASLNVNIGSASDPKNREGLAHMLEHMLFLGTDKYPQPGEYKDYLSSHGGSHNAYTAPLDTNYFFDVDKDYLAPALDRFAQFFIAPLFTAKYVNNERQVVHSEYQSKLRSDGWRTRSAQRQTYNPDHPMARFSIGSNDSLADRPDTSIRDELINFYQQHYSANLMTLAVLGKEPLDQLEVLVRDYFSTVKNTNAKALEINQPLFKSGQLPRRVDVIPIKDEQRVSLRFPLPPVQEYFRVKPARYISFLLGHEGEGSLLSVLKQHGWANSLWAGVSAENDYEAALVVSIDLSDAGLASLNDVINTVFQTIKLIQNEGVLEHIYQEQQRMAEIEFQFQESQQPIALVRNLSATMNKYPSQEWLRGPYLMGQFDAELIAQFAEYLRPDNVLVTVTSQQAQTDQVEQWFGTQYKVSNIEPDLLQQWQEAGPDDTLSIAAKNPFIPAQLSLKTAPDTASKPQLLMQTDGLKLWHQLDSSFGTPRAEYYFSVRSKRANDNPTHAMLTEMFTRMVEEQLGELSYPAYVAGLEYRIYKHMRGFSVRLSGYDEKMPLLLGHILEAIKHTDFDLKRFARIKADLQRSLLSRRENPPYHQTFAEISDLLLSPQWSDQQRLEALENIDLPQLQEFAPQLLSEIDIVALAFGNTSSEEARQLTAQLQQQLLQPAQAVAVKRGQLLQLSAGHDYARDLDLSHQDSALTEYLQGPDRSLTSRVLFGLFAEWLESPFFEKMRTEEKLGYIVFASSMPLLDVPALTFTVQSPIADPDGLQKHIDDFITQQSDHIEKLTAQDFERIKASLLSRILAKDQTPQERAERYWVEIDRDNAAFDTQEQLVKVVQEMDLATFQEAFKHWIAGPDRRRLLVRSWGQQQRRDAQPQAPSPVDNITDPAAFKKGLPFFSS